MFVPSPWRLHSIRWGDRLGVPQPTLPRGQPHFLLVLSAPLVPVLLLHPECYVMFCFFLILSMAIFNLPVGKYFGFLINSVHWHTVFLDHLGIFYLWHLWHLLILPSWTVFLLLVSQPVPCPFPALSLSFVLGLRQFRTQNGRVSACSS